LSSFGDKISGIEDALESSDIQVLSTLIHQLIGSSGSYGFLEITQQCTKIENQILQSPVINSNLRSEINHLTHLMGQQKLETGT